METLYLQQPSGTSSIELSDKGGCFRHYQTNEVSLAQENKSMFKPISKKLFTKSRTSSCLSERKKQTFSNGNLSQSVPSLQLLSSSASSTSTEKDVYSTPATIFKKGYFNHHHHHHQLKTFQENKIIKNSEELFLKKNIVDDSYESSNNVYDTKNLDEYLLSNVEEQEILKQVQGCVSAKQGNPMGNCHE